MKKLCYPKIIVYLYPSEALHPFYPTPMIQLQHSMFRFSHIRAQDVLKTKFGTGLIIFFACIFIASCLVLVLPVFDIDALLVSAFLVGSSFILIALLAVRFEQYFEKMLTVLALLFNIGSWILLLIEAAGVGRGPGSGAAVGAAFLMIQVFTLPKISRDLRAINPIYEKRFRWFLILLFLTLIFGSIALAVATN